jgi:hypothetical protein
MPDTTSQGSAPKPSETTAAPLPNVSEPSEGQRSSEVSISAEALAKIKEEIRADLKREINEAKSDKDRRLKDYERDKERIGQLFAYFKKFPDNPEAAEREYKLDRLLEEKEGSSPADLGKVKQKGLEERAREVLGKSGFVDKAEQDEIMREWAKTAPPGGYQTNDDALAGLLGPTADYRMAKSKRQTPASAGSAIQPKGGEPQVRDVQTIAAELLELQRGNLSDPTNQAARDALRAELRKARDK